jgi:hypothetical protein
MPAAEAVIRTGNADRYLARLRGHTGKMGTHLGQRLRHRGSGGTPPQVRHADWTATSGTVTLNWGQWTVHATPGILELRAEAADAENLRKIQDMLTVRLENFGRSEHLTVTWQPSGALAAGTAQAG